MKLALPILTGLAAIAWTAAPAQTGNVAGPRERISRLIVYGKDPCPRSEGDQIVVCARRPENERYRIPEALRDAPSTDPASTAWSVKAESMEYVGNTGIQSCSTVGPGGSTGCWAQLMRAAQAERRQPR